MKNVLVKWRTLLPSFDKERCTKFVLKSFSAINKSKLFCIPSWIPPFAPPQVPFNLDPPSYQQITNIIRNMKSSGSPCSLDQISIISFKRCPYLRSYITEIIKVVWSSGTLPNNWKKACTVLAHKKGDTNDPGNFRPITLESILFKIFTSALRYSIFDFLRSNDCVEHEIQTGFTPKLSGTVEHTSLMAHIIYRARVRQRSLVITLLDLKNAFGEVHHNLISEVLRYHHIPIQVQNLIKNLYTGFKSSILTISYILSSSWPRRTAR